MGNKETVKQYIVVRKDARTRTGAPMGAGKLAVMVAHASIAFLSRMVQKNSFQRIITHKWMFSSDVDDETKSWLDGIFTKILLEAKTLHSLERVVEDAESIGLVEDVDFFCIRDNCLTELLPDEGADTCFVAIGFRPMEAEKLAPVVKRLQLYKD